MNLARFLVSVLCAVAIQMLAHADERPGQKQFMIQLRLLEGDPKGTREAGTLRVVAEPILVTTNNRPVRINVGGEKPLLNADRLPDSVPFGTAVDVKLSSANGGRVFVDLMIECTQVTEEQESRVATSGRIVRFKGTLKLEELATIPLSPNASGQPTWAEITLSDSKKLASRTEGSKEKIRSQDLPTKRAK